VSYFRPAIDTIEGYTPGFQPAEPGYIKLNTNENPYPPSPRALAAIREACVDRLRKYPAPGADAARQVIAQVFDTCPECVLCGNGSDDLLNIAIRSFCGRGDVVAFPSPTYSLYDVLARIQEAKPVRVDFPDDYSLPTGLAGTDARLVIVSNPNAPTATFVPPEELSRLAEAVDGVLLIDEAYADFAERNCLELARRHDNVVVTRTVSKSYSLAGLRFGFAVARPHLIRGMMKVKDSYNVGTLPAVGAAAAIADQNWLRRNVARVCTTRGRLIDGLGKLGFRCLPSQANFVLARAPEGHVARTLFEELFRRKILVRYFDLPRVDDCLRITVGTDDETDACLAALADIVQG